MPAKIIAFTGLASAGKTTAASPVIYEMGYYPLSFATPIKRMIEVLTPSMDKNERPEILCGKSIREAYQTLGTEWGRKMIHDNIWVEIGRRIITSRLLYNGNSGVVIDDLRFNNEAVCVKEMGGIIIEVQRPGLIKMEHASESGISPELIDCSINNKGSVQDLQSEVIKIIKTLI
jgi:hypothetical protein